MTSGAMLPLMTADMLAMTIVGSVLENMDMERLIAGEAIPNSRYKGRCTDVLEIGTQVAQRIKEKGETMQSVEEVAQ